jgi:type IV pilus assembly protein PilB
MQNPSENSELILLRFMVQGGLITPSVAKEAEVAFASSKGESVLSWLSRNKGLSEEDCAQAIAERMHLPYVDPWAVPIEPEVIALLREDLATKHRVVPVRAYDGVLVVATSNPLNRDAPRAIEFATGLRVHLEVATPTAVNDAIDHSYHLEDALNAYLRGVSDESEVPVAELPDESADVKALLRGSTLPPVVKLFNLILLEGIRHGASDVHIEAGVAAVQVRYRIDGMLEESFRLPKWVHDPLVARCKVLASLDITERRVPQDGRIRIRHRDSMVDLRVSSLPTQFGEKLTMRILDSSAAPTGLDQLGLSDRDVRCLRQAMSRPEGMILVTGPTGSGKTTTLYGMLAEMISPTRNIVTIENPIEYQIRGINQVEINERQGLTFATTLRSILRQDPDVIFVGEIRDHETAEIALRAAQTGHLVLSTLHTNDTVSTITRLLDIGIEPYMLASSLHAVVSQRLVRRVCERCAAPLIPDADAVRALQIQPNGHRFRRGRGCAACRKSGYSGRVAVFEVMPVTPALEKLIESRATESTLRLQAREEGMLSLYEHAAAKVCAGVTTPEEILRVVDVPDESQRCPSCSRRVEETFSVCPHCGTSLHSNCSKCNMKQQKDWQMCPYCGTPRSAQPPPSARARPPAAAQPGAGAPARSFRALVVDDQPDFRHLLKFTLEHGGLPLSVVAVASGAEALELASEQPPDLIVLDIMMPEMDGFEVCRQLRAHVRTAFVPILMLTALDDADNRARGFLAGTDDYIGKPFARAELLARVRRLLERTYGLALGDRKDDAPVLPSRPRPHSNGGEQEWLSA